MSLNLGQSDREILNVIKDKSIDMADFSLTNKQNMSKSQIQQKFKSFLANKKKKENGTNPVEKALKDFCQMMDVKSIENQSQAIRNLQ